MSSEKWIRLVRGNDWGTVFFAKRPCPGTWGKARDGVVDNFGKTVAIRWPDGSVTSELIGTASHSQYQTGCVYPIVVTAGRGISGCVDLDKVEVLDDEWPLISETEDL